MGILATIKKKQLWIVYESCTESLKTRIIVIGCDITVETIGCDADTLEVVDFCRS